MSFARTAFGRGQRTSGVSDNNLRRDFWRKLRGALAHVPFAEELLAAYYCAFDHATPTQAKAALLAAIAYFVLPFDAIPDMLPIIGFTDDAAVLAATIKLVASHITPEHRQAAREKLQELNNQ